MVLRDIVYDARPNIKRRIAGEDLTAGDAVYLSDDETVKKTTNASCSGYAFDGIAMESVAKGEWLGVVGAPTHVYANVSGAIGAGKYIIPNAAGKVSQATNREKALIIGYAVKAASSGKVLMKLIDAPEISSAYIGSYSIIVYKDDSKIYAKDRTGDIIAIGKADEEDTQIIQYAVDSLPTSGGRLFLSTGEYTLSSSLVINYPHTIIGAGKGATILKTNGYFDAIQMAPASASETESLSIRDLTLNGNSLGRYGLYFNSKVVGYQFWNIAICSFKDFGIYENSNWGNTYIGCKIMSNGRSSVDTGGICIFSNVCTFLGCRIDWNGVGVIARDGYGSSFYNCVIEGNRYHGVYAYSTPSESKYPQHVTLENCQFELNNQANASNIYDIYLADSNVGYWSLINIKTTGGYVAQSIRSHGWFTYLANIRSSEHCYISGKKSTKIQCDFQDDASLGDGIRTIDYDTTEEGAVVNKFIRRLNINNWAETCPEGGVVVYRATEAGEAARFTATTTKGDPKVLGVADEDIGYTSYGRIQIEGKTTKLKVNGSDPISPGDYLCTYTERWVACKADSGDTVFALALGSYDQANSSGVIDALLISPRKI